MDAIDLPCLVRELKEIHPILQFYFAILFYNCELAGAQFSHPKMSSAAAATAQPLVPMPQASPAEEAHNKALEDHRRLLKDHAEREKKLKERTLNSPSIRPDQFV